VNPEPNSNGPSGGCREKKKEYEVLTLRNHWEEEGDTERSD